MSRRISILGSTGSIGRQSLEVIAACGMTVGALTANASVELMEVQVRQFQPELAVMMDEKAAADLKVRLADTNTRVASGMDGLLEAAELPSADTVITAVVGMIGLRPTMAAIREGKRIWCVPGSWSRRRPGTGGRRFCPWTRSTRPCFSPSRGVRTGKRSSV